MKKQSKKDQEENAMLHAYVSANLWKIQAKIDEIEKRQKQAFTTINTHKSVIRVSKN